MILMVGGIGFELNFGCDPRTRFQSGQNLDVYTYTNVREDALELYAFSTIRERDVFHKLRGVTGIGAKSAIAMVAFQGADSLIKAIISKDEKALLKLPGCGKKTAARILLELEQAFSGEDIPADLKTEMPTVTHSNIETVILALESLGYQKSEIDAVKSQLDKDSTDESRLLKQALALLGQHRS